MAEQVTSMILKLKVDLQCSCCYKKVKKLLCKFPGRWRSGTTTCAGLEIEQYSREIRDQEYDEKQNLVKIKVACCNPEKIRDKLCCKGGKLIKSIEIVKPPKPNPNPTPHEDGKDKEDGKEKKRPPHEEKPKPTPAVYCCVLCWEGYGGGPCYCGCAGRPVLPPPCYHNYGCRCAYGYGKGCYVSRCDYFSEENTGACNIM